MSTANLMEFGPQVLTDSVSNGKPDNQSLELSTRISNLNNVMEATTKPVLFDADNGGRIEHLQ